MSGKINRSRTCSKQQGKTAVSIQSNLTEEELKEINKGRQNKTKINDGILSDKLKTEGHI
jgi:hypothetical protein